MSSPEPLEPLFAPLAAVQRIIEQFNNRGVIIGGVAASLLGQPRRTADALLLLSLDQVPQLVELAQAQGLQPRIPDVVEFARRSRVVLFRHAESGIDGDIALGTLPFELEAVERSREHQAGALRIQLPTPEDLIILKAVAHRPQDLLLHGEFCEYGGCYPRFYSHHSLGLVCRLQTTSARSTLIPDKPGHNGVNPKSPIRPER